MYILTTLEICKWLTQANEKYVPLVKIFQEVIMLLLAHFATV